MKKSVYLLIWLSFMMANGQISFQDQASARGVGETCGIINYGGGISFYDYNNDGWDDITLATENNENLKIFKNTQDGFFIPDTALIPFNNFQQKQVLWVDFDNDGDNDLFITSTTNGNRLYRNDTVELVDVTASSGLPLDNLYTFGASWGDYNNDGFLDVFICNRDLSLQIPNYLFKNKGDGTFVNVSMTSGIGSGSHLSLCAAFFDYNNDGWQDIYVSNDKIQTVNLLYHNNGDGTFTEMGEVSGTNVAIDAMSTTIGDYNNDGWFDIYVTNGPNGNVLFKNNGDGTFTNMAEDSGTTFNSSAWSSVFLDAENDGDLDLYVSSESSGINPEYMPAAFYENLGNNTFTVLNNGSFNNDNRESYSNAIGDIDNDGYPEIVVSNSSNEDLFLWKNLTTTTNNWLKVKLQGVTSNRQGVGSRIEISVNGQEQYRYTLCGEGYLGQNSGSEFFGLSSNLVVDYVKVTWLSGIEDVLYDVPVNQTLNIVEGSTLSVYENQFVPVVKFKNPISDKLLVISSQEINEYEIYDELGKTIINKVNDGVTLDVDIGFLESGLYFCKLKFNNSYAQTLKLIKK
ncbi:FG-GAP-like repeat-containing protein [Winogradskyella marincola]|uniref:FG-GAP-like repeat-containing protein n=1 Tax=Winogradskyella marincola TaxID=3037795 RepID=A0ABT6G5E6_9FLAO|nr:FG-GAP-like repeat-containing protein [Winogradskyella sp. YYF002]MDG4717264.1 FG-GAP-like repeat-containing protein [Winogradskyella sp. YYF002]